MKYVLSALSKSEREQFLAQPRIAALSVNAGNSRRPLSVPIWNQDAPSGQRGHVPGLRPRRVRRQRDYLSATAAPDFGRSSGAVIVASEQLLFRVMGADRLRATARTERRLPTDV